jgi:hypothetical protein
MRLERSDYGKGANKPMNLDNKLILLYKHNCCHSVGQEEAGYSTLDTSRVGVTRSTTELAMEKWAHSLLAMRYCSLELGAAPSAGSRAGSAPATSALSPLVFQFH